MWETVEAKVREEAQRRIQELLEEEVETFLERAKSERRAVVGGKPGTATATASRDGSD